MPPPMYRHNNLLLNYSLRGLAIKSHHGDGGIYGGLLFALFLVGWGLAFLWGPIADKYGRVFTDLMLTIIWVFGFYIGGGYGYAGLAFGDISIAGGNWNWR